MNNHANYSLEELENLANTIEENEISDPNNFCEQIAKDKRKIMKKQYNFLDEFISM